MSNPYVGAKFRIQYLSHTVRCPIWVVYLLNYLFSPLGQGDGCAQLDHMDLDKKLMHMLLAPWKRGNLPRMTSCDPPT
jgi:hypothetical protein